MKKRQKTKHLFLSCLALSQTSEVQIAVLLKYYFKNETAEVLLKYKRQARPPRVLLHSDSSEWTEKKVQCDITSIYSVSKSWQSETSFYNHRAVDVSIQPVLVCLGIQWLNYRGQLYFQSVFREPYLLFEAKICTNKGQWD